MSEKKKTSWFVDTRNKIQSKPWLRFVIHLMLAFIVAVLLIFSAKWLLGVITNHNEEIVVPDLSNMTVDQARAIAEEKDLVIDVTDSVYIKRMSRGAVYHQNPQPGSIVKSGRRIVLTINSVKPRRVMMPNLCGLSMRQAKSEILARGLALGKFIYQRDMATNTVLSQKYKGQDIKPGTILTSESVIDLHLGMSPKNSGTSVPKVSGFKYMLAVDAVRNSSLNITNCVFDSSVKTYDDSLNAVVYKQKPSGGASSRMGTGVTLYLSLDEEVLSDGKKK